MRAAARNHRRGAPHIGDMIIGVSAPDTDLRRDVEHRLHPAAGRPDGIRIIQTRADEARAPLLQIRRGPAGQHRDAAPLGQQALNQVPAEETRAAGHQRRAKFQVTSIKCQDREALICPLSLVTCYLSLDTSTAVAVAAQRAKASR